MFKCDPSAVGGPLWFGAPRVCNTSEDWPVTRQTHAGEWYMSQQGFVRFTWTVVRDVLPGNLVCGDNAPLVEFNRPPPRVQITTSVNDVENGTSNDPTCTELGSNDSSTIYPDGTCVHEKWTSGDITLHATN